MSKPRPKKLSRRRRAFSLRAFSLRGASGVDLETRTATFPFSSEEPVDMWYGTEILSHAPGAMRQGTRQANMPLLFNHNRHDLLGVVESISIGSDARAYAAVRFGRDARGDWAMQQAADGILVNVSFMYRVYRFDEDVETETYTATDWEPYEVSLVTVPADATVGLGRAEADNAIDIEIHTRGEPPTQAAAPNPEPAAGGFFSAQPPKGNEMPKLRALKQDQAAADGAPAGGGTAADLNAIRAEALRDERARVTEIEAMCRAHGIHHELRDQMVRDGTSIAESRGRVLIELGKTNTQKPLVGVSDAIGMSDKEKRSYSLMRAVNAAVNNNWEAAGFEREVSQALSKRNGSEPKNGTSFFFPTDLPFAPSEAHRQAYAMMTRAAMAQRAIYQVGTAGQGGNIVATNLLADNFIEVLRNSSVTAKLGAMMLPGLVGGVDLPTQATATGTYWVGESGALTEAEATFGKVSLRPKTVGALSKVSRLMLLQSTPAIEMLVRRDLIAVGALAIDLASLSGSGSSNQPTGIVNTAGIGSVVGGTNGAALTFDNLIQLKYATRAVNAPQNSSGFAMNSKTIGFLSTLKSSTGSYLWDPQGGLTADSPDRVKGAPYAESNQLRSNLVKGSSGAVCSELIYGGSWQELIIGEWGITEIAVNPYDSTGFANGDIILRMFQTIDIGVRHAASFSAMSDALTTGF